ncbi:helix-hairpin-helix domain-containing protein [Cryobacterium sp. PAMC25264]|uniref:ComEA family DNA-binding protein n=1 Tax=Cryobacterium sp. PAMC25264 TaxID=2861288 RepID=UPI002104516A|nr:helix-hairpin-helix domain-containing protein [Cryobacterium sp. PAMC25264]
MDLDPFDSLAPASRPGAAGWRARLREPGRARMRIGVGAAVVLLLAALGIAVAVTAVGQVGHSVEVAANRGSAGSAASGSATPGPDGPQGTAGIVGAQGSPGVTTAGKESAGDGATGELAAAAPAIFVHVLGAVAHPGLFEVHDGARVVDAVAAAGGLLATADQAGVNLARLVSDGEQLYVPAQGEVVAGAPPVAAGGGGSSSGAGGTGSGAAAVKVNLNTATLAELDTLPRIGPTMAQRILDYRDAQGRFGTIDDLRNVTGIGEKTFAALQDLITV